MKVSLYEGMALWTVRAEYDPASKVWWTAECDVPGLVTEGETLERLRERVVAVLPEMVELNAHHIEPERRQGPHSLRLIAHYDGVTQIAA